MITPRLFGANDEVPCVRCGEMMMVTRRSPHPVAAGHELQTLTCYACSGQAERGIDRDGKILGSPAAAMAHK